MASFTEKLDKDALEFFNEVCKKKFSEQAIAFLNAYWPEVGSQAEFVFSVSWEMIKYADMHTKGVSYVHLYDEGDDLDFNIGLYFYEKLCKFCEDNKDKWATEEYAASQPEMMTAIVRKKELREKVDVNFDGRVSFLEYLLYQYKDVANPADFCKRSMGNDQEEHPEITKAKAALAAAEKAMKDYEKEKMRLEEGAKQSGVKGIRFKHELAQLGASPLMEQINKTLITAAAAVRIATRKFGGGKAAGKAAAGAEDDLRPTEGTIWWLKRDLQAKQERYGKKSK